MIKLQCNLLSGLLILAILLFFSEMNFAQTAINRHEMPEHFFLTSIEADGVKLFTKYKGAAIAYNKRTKEILLYGEINDDEIIIIHKVKHEMVFNPDEFRSCTYSNDGKVTLCSMLEKRTEIVCGIFNWVDESLVYDKYESTDESLEIIKRASLYLKQQKAVEALSAYDSLRFPESYINTEEVAAKILKAMRPVVKEQADKKKFKEAVALYQSALTYRGWKWADEIESEDEMKNRFGKNLFGLTLPDFHDILVEYLLYLNEARMSDQVVKLYTKYRKWFPSSTGLLLQIADAYYLKKENEKAGELYSAYVAKMKELKKDKQIPDYVAQRMK